MLEVIRSGMYTTIQDYPGRIGYWNVGVPPSGPMDSLSFRIANRLVGNSDEEAGLEITILGPKLRFQSDATVAFTGAKLKGTLNGGEVPWWQSLHVEKGSVLDLSSVDGAGCRSYMAVHGGIDAPEYLGSKATFPKGNLGGYNESSLLPKGTVIRFNNGVSGDRVSRSVDSTKIPELTKDWTIGAIPGPHTDPDYFTPETVHMFFNTEWRVHPNSNRLGYRLEGETPSFARDHGGEGGSHPSNIIDYPYAIGTVNFSGNLPVILTVDGPSLGGFISLATVPSSELWKVGQAKPNNTIRFRKMNLESAVEQRAAQEQMLRDLMG